MPFHFPSFLVMLPFFSLHRNNSTFFVNLQSKRRRNHQPRFTVFGYLLMDAMKTRSKTKFRTKFLLCFRPVTKDDSFKPRKQKVTTGPVLTYVVTAKKETVVLPSLLPPTLPIGDEAKDDCSWRKKCSVWKALKRALKETPLVSLHIKIFIWIFSPFFLS